MSWVDDSRALRASALSADGVGRLAAALDEDVEAVGPLHGGVSSSVYELRTPTRRLVLKRFAVDDAAALEWERLHIAGAVPIPTPEPVALDTSGTWFGAPALVVTYLAGEPMWPPRPETLGRLLAVIHATPPPDPVPAVLQRPALWQKWTPPAPPDPPVEFPGGLVDAVRRLQTIAAGERNVLSHCDFHPGNVIVGGEGEVTGVIDWASCRLTPAGLDAGIARCDLAIEPGGDAPDRFLAAYEEASGATVRHRPLWDALGAARALQHGHGWVDAWTDVGVPMTAERIRDRVSAFAGAALVDVTAAGETARTQRPAERG